MINTSKPATRNRFLLLACLALAAQPLRGQTAPAEPNGQKISSPDKPAFSGYADIGKVKLYYEIRGAGRPVLLLHGGLSSSGDFEAIRPALARSFRVISVDRRGHGRSADTPDPFSYAGMAEEIKAFLDIVQPGPVDVVGFSDGGVVAYHLASRHPEAVGKVVASGANIVTTGMTAEALAWTRDRMAPAALAMDYPFVEKNFRSLNPHPDHYPVFVEKTRDLWLRDPYIAVEDFAKIRSEVLLMVGENDDVRLAHVLEMKALLKNARLCVIPGATHFVFSEKPGLVVPVLLDFLSGQK